MNKLRVSWIIWGMIMVAIVVLLFVFGITLSRKNKPYKDKENELVEITKMYVESSTWYPTQGNHIKITIDELIEKEIITEVKVEDDSCDGYVEVSNNGIIEYKTYLKCQNYETHGYE